MDPKSHRQALAQELLRELLDEARREQERAQATGERLRALVRAGRHAGLAPTQVAEASGLSRPGVYEVQRRQAQGPVDGLDEIVLAMLGVEGATTRQALAAVLGVPEALVSEAVERLAHHDAVAFGAAGYGKSTMSEVLFLSPTGERLLDERMRYALGRRPEEWTAYLSVSEHEAQKLFAAAQRRYGTNRTALLPASVRHDMEAPELAISFDVADAVGLMNSAAAAWHDLREELKLDPQPVRIAAYVAPSVRSDVLEAFGRGMLDILPPDQPRLTRLLADARPRGDEKVLCVRALTEAAWGMRRAVGERRRPRELSTGDDAFDELRAVVGMELDSSLRDARRSLVDALDLAAERLGPLAGGRMGSFRAPGFAPAIVEQVSPTHRDLMSIARAAGEAIGRLALATGGSVDPAVAVEAVIEGRSTGR